MFWTWCKLQPIASEERCNVGWLWLIRGLMANRTLQLSNYKWHWIPEQECMQHAQLRRKDLIFLMFCSVVFEAQLVTKDYLIWDGTNITFLCLHVFKELWWWHTVWSLSEFTRDNDDVCIVYSIPPMLPNLYLTTA